MLHISNSGGGGGGRGDVYTLNTLPILKAMLYGAIFLATCDAILLLRDVNQ